MTNTKTKSLKKKSALIKRLEAYGFKNMNKPGLGFGIAGFPYVPAMDKSRKKK